MSGQKIIQFLLLPVWHDEIVEIPLNELHPDKTERGIGGFGSTGTT
jgi:dUTPase